jgi:hypothetical protein
VPMTGTGASPQISFTNTSSQTITGLSYGAIASGTMFATPSGQQALPYNLPGQPFYTQSAPQTIVVTNSGPANTTLKISGVVISTSSTDPNDFLVTNNCASASLSSGQSCNVVVIYAPITVPYTGTSTATLTFTDNNLGTTGSTQTLSLSGIQSHDIVLSWNASTTYGVSSYLVYSGTSTGQEVLTAPIFCMATTQNTASVPSCADPNPSLSTSAATWYTVAAVASGIQSPVASPDTNATSKGP